MPSPQVHDVTDLHVGFVSLTAAGVDQDAHVGLAKADPSVSANAERDAPLWVMSDDDRMLNIAEKTLIAFSAAGIITAPNFSATPLSCSWRILI